MALRSGRDTLMLLIVLVLFSIIIHDWIFEQTLSKAVVTKPFGRDITKCECDSQSGEVKSEILTTTTTTSTRVPESTKRISNAAISRTKVETLDLPKLLSVPGLVKLNTTFGSTGWRQYLPQLDAHLTKVESGFVKWPIDVRRTTSPNTTHLTVETGQGPMFVGDTLKATIIARDFDGKDKTYGGDYFIARLIRILPDGKTNNDGIACHVKDEGTGRYKVSVPLVWSGKSHLIVHMVHSSEGITQLVHNTSAYIGPGAIHQATFPLGEKTQCDVMLAGQKPENICDFSEPEKGVSWFCVKPKNESCPKAVTWMETTYTWAAETHLIMGVVDPLYQKYINWNVPINGSGSAVVVFDDGQNERKELTTCKTNSGMQMLDHNLPSGLFIDGRWKSLHCANQDSNMARLKRCFQNKVVYLIGDSTMRQWYYEIAGEAELVTKSENTTVVWQQPRTGTNKAYNITVYYRGHSNPVHNPGPPRSSPFLTDTIDGITGSDGKDIMIFFNIGLHFNLYDPSVFLQRLTAVKNSFITLLRRLPKAKIVIRGTNGHESSKITCPSHWFSYRFHKILQTFFSDIPGVGFLDTWDMTTVHPQEDVHPDKNMVLSQITMMLSYVCGTV
ncbi:NXPE family member 3-like [Ciona intestinalis]